MTALPNALALESIADESPIVASSHRNNYSAIQAAVNELTTALGGGSANAVLAALSGTSVSWVSAGTAYTPAWTAVSANPAIGNGTIVGRYVRVGPLVMFHAIVTAGSTTTFGTGQYSISLPVNAHAAVALFAVTALDTSAVATYYGNAVVDAGLAKATLSSQAAPAAAYNSASPFAWASGDKLLVAGVYLAA